MHRHEILHPLSHQHHNGLMSVLMLKKGVERKASMAEMKRFILHSWETELRVHFIAEEVNLNPEVLQCPELQTYYFRMKQEHGKLRELILRIKEHDPSIELIKEFYNLLEQHIRFEERELFQAIQERVSEESLSKVGKNLSERSTSSCATYPVKFWE